MSTQPLGSLHWQPTMENLTTNTAIDPERLDRLITHIKDYQITHGFLLKIVRLEQPTTVPCRPVNVSILPTHFPKTLFEEAIGLQDLYTDLYARAVVSKLLSRRKPDTIWAGGSATWIWFASTFLPKSFLVCHI